MGATLSGSATFSINTLSTSSGASNTAVGAYSLGSNTNGAFNVGVGYGALFNNISGQLNVAIGYQAANQTTSGGYNTSIGYQSFYFNTTGLASIAIGYRALYLNTIGNFNTALGYRALYSTNADKNTALGAETMFSNLTGTFNTALGQESLRGNTAGSFNTAVGTFALLNSESNYTTALGRDAGRDSTVGALIGCTESLFLGYNSRSLSTTSINEIVIGASASGNGSNSMTLGSDAITKTILKGNIGVGTASPANVLDVVRNQVGSTRINIENTNATGISTLRFSKLGGAAAALYENSTNEFTFQNATNGGTLRLQTTTSAGATNTALTIDSNQNIGIGITTPTSKLEVTGSITATSSIAKGVSFTPTLLSSANNDVLIGLDISPTFTGTFSGVTNNALRVKGNIILSENNTYDIGNIVNNLRVLYSNVVTSNGVLTLDTSNSNSIVWKTSNIIKMQLFGSTGNLAIQSGTAGSLVVQGDGTLTDAGFKLDVQGTTRLNGKTTVSGTMSATSSLAQAMILTPTLLSSANNDVLIGLDISPTFTNGTFSGNQNLAVRSTAAAKFGKLLIGSLNNPTLSSAIVSATGGTIPAATYYYKVVAVDFDGSFTAPSNELSVTTTGTSSSVLLSWSVVSGANGYRVFRSTASNTYSTYFFVQGNTGVIAPTASFTDRNLNALTGIISTSNNSSYGIFDTSKLRTNNIRLINNGVGTESSILFEKTNDSASISVIEYADDRTMYEFKMTDNPDTSGDVFHWFIGDNQNPSTGWKPLRFSGLNSQFVALNSSFWSSFSLPSSTPYYTTNADTSTNADIKGDPYTSTTYNLLKDASGGGTGTLNVDVTKFSLSITRTYWILITSPTTFNWGIQSPINTSPIGTNIVITGAFQPLDNGVQIKLSASGHLANDRWAFRAFPTPKMGIGTTTATAAFQVSSSITSSGVTARGVYFNPTLVASANNNVLVGLDISPTFSNGTFSSVTNISLRVAGNIEADSFKKNGGTSSEFLKADGSVDSSDYAKKTITVRKISTATTLANSDNATVILATASCTVTLPNDLMTGFNVSFATQTGATLTYSLGNLVTLINNSGLVMPPQSSHTLVNTGVSNEYLTVGL
jgi:hypothetical protein